MGTKQIIDGKEYEVSSADDGPSALRDLGKRYVQGVISPTAAGAPERPVPDVAAENKEEAQFAPKVSDTTSAMATGGAAGESIDEYLVRAAPRVGGDGAGKPGELVYGAKFAELGGPSGKSAYEDVTQNYPLRIAESLQEGARAQSEEGKALAEAYGKQSEEAAMRLADMRSRQQLEQQEMAAREQEIQQRTASYTKDLADSGKFWRNPGNVLSAIAFSLMPIAAGGRDPEIGIRLVNQAIESDLAQRRQLADGHLGALRSNLSEYRKIAGDRQAGDQLAHSEALKVAALDVQRIGAQFQGAKAKAEADRLSNELMMKSTMLGMQVYQSILQKLQVMDPRAAKALMASPDYENFLKRSAAVAGAGIPGESGGTAAVRGGATPGATSAPVAGAPTQAGAATVTSVQPGAARVMPGQALMPGATVSMEQPAGGPGKDSDFDKKMGDDVSRLLKGQVDVNAPQVLSALVSQPHHAMFIRSELAAKLHREPTQGEFQNAWNHYWIGPGGKVGPEQMAKIKETALPVIPRVGAISRTQQQMKDLETVFGGDQAKLNDFLGKMRGISPEKYAQIDQALARLGISNTERAQKARELWQGINKTVLEYAKAKLGAITEPDAKRLLGIVGEGASWDQLSSFVRSESRDAGHELRARLAGGNPYAAMKYMAEIGQEYPILNSPGVSPRPKGR